MTPGARAWTLVAKETRALLPIWMACVLAGSVAALMDGVIHALSVLAFGAGMIALGAYSIGHEYTYRTLGLMLTLPADRRRLFLVKLGVLAAMVLPLAAYASLLRLLVEAPEVRWLIAAGALCLAPSLTMLCRNPLAGAVFSTSVSAILLAAVMMILVGGWNGPADAERAAFVTWSRLMVVVFAGGAVLGWRVFNRPGRSSASPCCWGSPCRCWCCSCWAPTIGSAASCRTCAQQWSWPSCWRPPASTSPR